MTSIVNRNLNQNNLPPARQHYEVCFFTIICVVSSDVWKIVTLIFRILDGSAETEGIEVWSRVYFGHWSPTHLPVITVSKPVFYSQQSSPVFDEGYNWLNPKTAELPVLVGTAALDIHLNNFYTWTMQMGCSAQTQVKKWEKTFVSFKIWHLLLIANSCFIIQKKVIWTELYSSRSLNCLSLRYFFQSCNS